MDNNFLEERLKQENFKKLSEEEKRKTIHELIHSGVAENATLFNSDIEAIITISELVEQIGEEETIDFIIKLIENSKVLEGSFDIDMLEDDAIEKLLDRVEKNECTPEEAIVLKILHNKINSNNERAFGQTCISGICDVINFAQKEIKYNPKLEDFLVHANLLLITSSVCEKTNGFQNYTMDDMNTIMEMIHQIGEDIYSTWENSCDTLPEPALIINALIFLACKIASESNIKFANADKISEALGFPINEDDNINGSNTDNDFNSYDKNEDKEMRDLLKS